MNDTESRLKTIESLMIVKGREAAQLAFIIKKEAKHFDLLVDGEKRKYDRPKKKHFNHMIPAHFISPEVQNSLLGTGRVTNGKLRMLYRSLSK